MWQLATKWLQMRINIGGSLDFILLLQGDIYIYVRKIFDQGKTCCLAGYNWVQILSPGDPWLWSTIQRQFSENDFESRPHVFFDVLLGIWLTDIWKKLSSNHRHLNCNADSGNKRQRWDLTSIGDHMTLFTTYQTEISSEIVGRLLHWNVRAFYTYSENLSHITSWSEHSHRWIMSVAASIPHKRVERPYSQHFLDWKWEIFQLVNKWVLSLSITGFYIMAHNIPVITS